MAYDDIFFSAINKAHDLKKPQQQKKPSMQMPSQTSNAMADMVASHVVGMLVEKINEKTPPQKLEANVSIEHDAKHWEALIDKLKELVITAPNINVSPSVPSINVAAPDNSIVIEAINNLTKLIRAINQPKEITLNVVRDEDGKMAQIIIEQR
jgi:hypothetical protein